jgi:hypothetical protein
MISLLIGPISQVFNGVLPDLVTSEFAAKFLLTLSAANLGTNSIRCYIKSIFIWQ